MCAVAACFHEVKAFIRESSIDSNSKSNGRNYYCGKGQTGSRISFRQGEVIALARQTQKIRTVSYIHVGDKLVCTDDLNAEQKKYVATRLKQQYMNALFKGKAEFGLPDDLPAAEDVFPELKKQA